VPEGLGAQFANERSERKLRDKGIIRLKQLLGQSSFYASALCISDQSAIADMHYFLIFVIFIQITCLS